MPTTSINYAANTAITMTLSGLASSAANTVGGWGAAQIDNTASLFVDALVQGTFTVGTPSVTTGGLSVFVLSSNSSIVGTPIPPFDGTNTAANPTTTQQGVLKFAAFVPVMVVTTDAKYSIPPFSVAALFGGVMPKFWTLYISQNTGVALKTDAANNNSFSFNGIKFDSV